MMLSNNFFRARYGGERSNEETYHPIILAVLREEGRGEEGDVTFFLHLLRFGGRGWARRKPIPALILRD